MRRAALIGPLLWCAAAGCSGAPQDGPEPVESQSEPYTSVCPQTVVEGLDVYDGQGTIDWAKVAAAGKEFAFIKATQGNYNTQKTFAANWSGAKAAGVLRSPYHFFDATIPGATQATWFLNELATAGGLEAGDLPPMLDIECPTSSSQSQASANCEYQGNSGWAPSATIQTEILDFLAAVEKGTGRKAVLYSYPSWFADVGVTSSALADYPLFIATLSSCASVPAPWTTTVFWQYSFTGTVSGISGQVDLDRFLGDKAQLVAFASGPTPDGGATDGGADASHPHGGRDAAPDQGVTDAAGATSDGSDAGGAIEADGGGAAAPSAGPSSSGCGCAIPRRTTGPSGPGAALALLVGAARRRLPKRPRSARRHG